MFYSITFKGFYKTHWYRLPFSQVLISNPEKAMIRLDN